MSRLLDRISAELNLHRHNKNNRKGIVDPNAQRYFYFENILPTHIFEELLVFSKTKNMPLVRTNTTWRQGMAVGGHELLSLGQSPWIEYFLEGGFLPQLRERTTIRNLQWIPKSDTNRLSLLRYVGKNGISAGDRINWHVDGNIYLGSRWAGILTLSEKTTENTAKLEFISRGKHTLLSTPRMPNSLVLFQGDHIRHRVRPMLEGEERTVLSLLFSDQPTRTVNPLLLRYQRRVNSTFYGSN